MGKHFERRITDTSFTYQRNHAAIAAEAALDGIYVLRTNVAATELDAAAVVTGYKNLAHVERDFRSIKTDDLDLRPIHHRLTERVKAHVLICMLACYLTGTYATPGRPLTFTDEHPPQPRQPSRPRTTLRRRPRQSLHPPRPPTATHCAASAACSITWPPSPATRSATTTTGTEVPMLAEPTPDQRRAFNLIGTPIPLTAA